jgi:shikimate dehydrogenase
MTATIRYGLLGWPVKQSVSPQMQGTGFRALGIDASYELLPIEPEHFDQRIPELIRDGFAGWNITIPHKGPMLRHLDEIDPVAAQAESVNTVCNRDGRLHGWSTDGFGLERAVNEAFNVKIAGGTFVFWGTGGAARATATHFAHHGARSLTLVNRTVAKAEALGESISRFAPDCELRILSPADDDALRGTFADCSAIIQSSSVGMDGTSLSIPAALLAAGMNVMDMIYKQTPLLKAAAQLGCNTADGRAMLLYQGVKSFEIWTGRDAPVDAMRAALDTALDA